MGANGFGGILKAKGVAAIGVVAYYVNGERPGDLSSFSEGTPSILISDFSLCSPLVAVYTGA